MSFSQSGGIFLGDRVTPHTAAYCCCCRSRSCQQCTATSKMQELQLQPHIVWIKAAASEARSRKHVEGSKEQKRDRAVMSL